MFNLITCHFNRLRLPLNAVKNNTINTSIEIGKLEDVHTETVLQGNNNVHLKVVFRDHKDIERTWKHIKEPMKQKATEGIHREPQRRNKNV